MCQKAENSSWKKKLSNIRLKVGNINPFSNRDTAPNICIILFGFLCASLSRVCAIVSVRHLHPFHHLHLHNYYHHHHHHHIKGERAAHLFFFIDLSSHFYKRVSPFVGSVDSSRTITSSISFLLPFLKTARRDCELKESSYHSLTHSRAPFLLT